MLNQQYVTMGESGRIVIPSAIRKELGFEEGEELLIRLKDGELNMISRKRALDRILEKAKKLKKTGENVTDKFLKSRKEYSGE